MTHKPHIAIVMEDSLARIGLKEMLENIIPFAFVDCWEDMDQMQAETAEKPYHCFISARQWHRHEENLRPFMGRIFIVGSQEEQSGLPAGCRFLRADQSLRNLTKDLLTMQQSAHHHYGHYPQPLSHQLQEADNRLAATLTRREVEVLKMVARGKSSKEIAEALFISLNTVNTHRRNIMDKLGAHTATKLAAYAVNYGYIRPEEI